MPLVSIPNFKLLQSVISTLAGVGVSYSNPTVPISYIYKVLEDSSGNVVVLAQYCVFKLNAALDTVLWAYECSVDSNWAFGDCCLGPDDEVYLVTDVSGTNYTSVFFRINADGSFAWTANINTAINGTWLKVKGGAFAVKYVNNTLWATIYDRRVNGSTTDVKVRTSALNPNTGALVTFNVANGVAAKFTNVGIDGRYACVNNALTQTNNYMSIAGFTATGTPLFAYSTNFTPNGSHVAFSRVDLDAYYYTYSNTNATSLCIVQRGSISGSGITWTRVLASSTSSKIAWSLAENGDGDVYACCTLDSSTTNQIVKLSGTTGTILWAHTIPNTFRLFWTNGHYYLVSTSEIVRLDDLDSLGTIGTLTISASSAITGAVGYYGTWTPYVPAGTSYYTSADTVSTSNVLSNTSPSVVLLNGIDPY